MLHLVQLLSEESKQSKQSCKNLESHSSTFLGIIQEITPDLVFRKVSKNIIENLL